MKEISPEDIYAEYHYATQRVAKGIHVKRCTNFDKQKAKPEWEYFIKCANFCNSNNVYYKEYIFCLATYYGGWFKPQILGTAKSVKIYNDVKEKVVMPNDEETMKKECEKIYDDIRKSISYVVDHMIEKNYKDVGQYLNENRDLFPMVLQDLEDKKISIYFLCCFTYIKAIIEDYPQDMLDDFLPEYSKKLLIARSNVLCHEKTKKVAENIESLIYGVRQKRLGISPII